MKTNRGVHTCGFFLMLKEYDVDFTFDEQTDRVTLINRNGNVEFNGSYSLFKTMVERDYIKQR